MIWKNVFVNLFIFNLSLCLTNFLVEGSTDIKFTATPKEQKEKSTALPPCKSCSVLVESFKSGLEKTSRGKHAGGDAAWEEEKLRSYKTSEVRLVEIQEHLCSDVKRGADQCHSLANEHEHLIEQWFLHEQTVSPDLHVRLCIEHLKVCCPDGHYGSECLKCTDCNGNGKCKGSGTRKGNGQCVCDAGYAGDNCNECAVNYYESFRDASKLLCTPCHKSCEGGCTGPGPTACKKCAEGWREDELSASVCVDINECIEKPRACKPNQFCVNDEGSYSCLECDRACDGCDGDGPDMCRRCADGYALKDGTCEDLGNDHRERYANITRLLTYCGLCVATFVIFQNSVYIAYFIGAIVAIYITVSEYSLRWKHSGPDKGPVNVKELEEMLMKSL